MRQLQKKFLLLPILFMITMTACHFNSQYLNREEDKKEAEKITNELYQLLKEKNYDATTKLFSKKFFEVTDKEKLFKIFGMTIEKLGKLKVIEIEKWETRRVEGSNPLAEYAFVYKNTYSNFPARETIKLIREEDGKIRIIAYNINSDGFIEV